MSNYNTITSIGESPLEEDLVYAGPDDGLFWVTENGGENWRRIEVSEMANVPDLAFVNDVKASHHDPNTVYVALDNHKYGDFSPYLVKSTDRGRSWTSITGNIPDRHLVWRVVQDHVDPDLLFAATEFGVFFTVDGGGEWTELPGAPTISFRDVVIHREREDLVAASFGRGIFVLDDYTPLREGAEGLAGEAMLFETRPVDGPASAGVHRVAWDLEYSSNAMIGLEGGGGFGGGFWALPDTYTATLIKVEEGEVAELAGPVEFQVVPAFEGALERIPADVVAAFRQEVESLAQDLTETSNLLQEQIQKVEAMQTALSRADSLDPELNSRLYQTRLELLELRKQMRGPRAFREGGRGSASSPPAGSASPGAQGRGEYLRGLHRSNGTGGGRRQP